MKGEPDFYQCSTCWKEHNEHIWDQKAGKREDESHDLSSKEVVYNFSSDSIRKTEETDQ